MNDGTSLKKGIKSVSQIKRVKNILTSEQKWCETSICWSIYTTTELINHCLFLYQANKFIIKQKRLSLTDFLL